MQPPRKCGIPGIRGSQTLHCHTPRRKCGIPGIRGSPTGTHPEGSVEFLEFVEVRRSTAIHPEGSVGFLEFEEVPLPYTKQSRNTCINLEDRSKFYSEHCLTETSTNKLQHYISKSLYAGYCLHPHFCRINWRSYFGRHSKLRPLKSMQPEERSASGPMFIRGFPYSFTFTLSTSPFL